MGENITRIEKGLGENITGIEIIIGEKWEDYRSFMFRVKTYDGCNVFGRLPCQSCRRDVITYAYYYIINKLDKVGLLAEDFKFLCCDCYYIQEKVGTTKCKDCGALLRLDKYENIVEISCDECNLDYYKNCYNGEVLDGEDFIVFP